MCARGIIYNILCTRLEKCETETLGNINLCCSFRKWMLQYNVVGIQLVFKYSILILCTLHTFGNKEEKMSEEIQCDTRMAELI